jgi:hypothetical protein
MSPWNEQELRHPNHREFWRIVRPLPRFFQGDGSPCTRARTRPERPVAPLGCRGQFGDPLQRKHRPFEWSRAPIPHELFCPFYARAAPRAEMPRGSRSCGRNCGHVFRTLPFLSVLEFLWEKRALGSGPARGGRDHVGHSSPRRERIPFDESWDSHCRDGSRAVGRSEPARTARNSIQRCGLVPCQLT